MSAGSTGSAGSGQSDFTVLAIPDPKVSAQDLVRGNYTLAGSLRKRGKLNVIPGARKVFPWHHQFVVLHQGCLYCYKSETAKKPARAFSLYGYNTVYRAGEVLREEAPWAFKICHTYPEYKTYYFSAMTEQDMKEWMKQIKLEMKRANNKMKQRTRADGQDMEDDRSMSYEDIEREIYTDPSELVINSKTPMPPRQDEDSDEDYVDSDTMPSPTSPTSPPIPNLLDRPPLPALPKPALLKKPVQAPGSYPEAQSDLAQEMKQKLQIKKTPIAAPNRPTREKKEDSPAESPKQNGQRPDGNSFTKKQTVEPKLPSAPQMITGRTPSDDDSDLKSPSLPTEEAPPVPDSPGSSPDQDYWSSIYYKETPGRSAGELIRQLAQEGVFLIRDSKDGKTKVLEVFVDNIPKRYKIFHTQENSYYLVTSKHFDSIEDLIYYYHSNKLPCGVALEMPYFQHPKYKP